MDDDLVIRPMRRDEVDLLLDWAELEGWNPGVHDAELFWDTDPGAFLAAELRGKFIGGGSVMSYGGTYGFMGFFIMRPEYRLRGFGARLWHERTRRLQQRLETGATIGIDGAFALEHFYAAAGFRRATRDLRFEGTAGPVQSPHGIVALGEVSFDEVAAYDRRHFPAPREDFLKRWIAQPDSLAIGLRRDGALAAMGVMRRGRVGHRIGPLFADDAAAAEDVFIALTGAVSGDRVFLDVPEDNHDALALAYRHHMVESFGCARMYLGPRPGVADRQVFGVTSFELG